MSVSRERGASWTDAKPFFGTTGGSDHPQLMRRGEEIYLTWFTEAEGLRVVRIEETSPDSYTASLAQVPPRGGLSARDPA